MSNDLVSQNKNSGALASSLVISERECIVFEIRGYNTKASNQYIQIHDAASLPSNGAAPEDVLIAPASDNFYITYPNGKTFKSGVVVCNSSTVETKTIGSADCWFSTEYWYS